jgi:hypothetical protein
VVAVRVITCGVVASRGCVVVVRELDAREGVAAEARSVSEVGLVILGEFARLAPLLRMIERVVALAQVPVVTKGGYKDADREPEEREAREDEGEPDASGAGG